MMFYLVTEETTDTRELCVIQRHVKKITSGVDKFRSEHALEEKLIKSNQLN